MTNSPEDINQLKEDIKKGEYDKIENGKEVYVAPNNITIKIENPELADSLLGANQGISQQDPQQTRTETIYNATHGNDRATWRDESMKFTNSEQPGARLHFTQNQIEDARKEMEGDLQNKTTEEVKYEEGSIDKNQFGDTFDTSKNVEDNNSGYNIPEIPLTNAPTIEETKYQDITPKIEITTTDEETRRREAAQEEVKDVAIKNTGMTNAPPSKGLSDFLAWQDQESAKLKEEQRLREAKQKEIETNATRNIGMTNAPPSTQMSDALARQDEIANQLKEEQRLREAKEKEIATNSTRNIGMTNAPPSKGLSDYLDWQENEGKKFKEQLPTVEKESDINAVLEKMKADFEPSVKVARGLDGSERVMVPFTKYGSPRYGFEELKEALESKFVRDDGKVMITYKGGRTDNNGKPSYMKDLIFTQEQITNLESLVTTVDQNKVEVVNDLKKENFEESLTELMDEETAKRYLAFLGGNQEVIDPLPVDIDTGKQLDAIGEKISGINGQLETMNIKLGEINSQIQQLLEGQGVENLTQEKLIEYVKLLIEQGNTKDQIFQTTIEKYQTSIDNSINLILSRLNNQQPIQINVNQQQSQEQEVEIEQEDQQVQNVNQEEQPKVDVSQQQNQQQAQQQGQQSQQQNQQQAQQQGQQSQQQSQQQAQQQGQATQPQPVIQPVTASADAETIRGLQDQLRELRGENTWEQRSADYERDLQALDAIRETRPLTIAEKAQYFDLLKQKEYIDKNIIAPVEKENERKRIRKERIIKVVAGVAGAGVALATPAVGVAAVIAVTLGGRLIGKGLAKWGENLRSKSNAMKYESRRGKSMAELQEMDKKMNRREWWGKRLGEASAVFIGGATGYGLGKAVQGLFGWGQGATVETNPITEPTQPPAPGPQDPGAPINPTGPEVPPISEPISQELPNYLSFDQYPDMRVGLETRGMAEGMHNLIIHPTESLWSTAQRQAVEALVNQGVNLNTREAGYAIGDLASNLINNGQAITPDAVTQALAEAATKFGQ